MWFLWGPRKNSDGLLLGMKGRGFGWNELPNLTQERGRILMTPLAGNPDIHPVYTISTEIAARVVETAVLPDS